MIHSLHEGWGRPLRIQRRRTKGWRRPPGTVYVGRPSKWGNPFQFVWCDPDDAKRGLSAYREWVAAQIKGRPAQTHRIAEVYAKPAGLTAADLHRLRGKALACWCRLCPAHANGKPLGVDCPACAPCHADVLLELANPKSRTSPVTDDEMMDCYQFGKV